MSTNRARMHGKVQPPCRPEEHGRLRVDEWQGRGMVGEVGNVAVEDGGEWARIRVEVSRRWVDGRWEPEPEARVA